MSPEEAARLKPGDELLLEGVCVMSAAVGLKQADVLVRGKVVTAWDGNWLGVLWGKGADPELVGVSVLAFVKLHRGPIEGVPREVLAFCAGLHAAGQRHWRAIAAAVEASGLGAFHPSILDVATHDWIRQSTRRRSDVDEVIAAAVRRTPTGRPS